MDCKAQLSIEMLILGGILVLAAAAIAAMFYGYSEKSASALTETQDEFFDTLDKFKEL